MERTGWVTKDRVTRVGVTRPAHLAGHKEPGGAVRRSAPGKGREAALPQHRTRSITPSAASNRAASLRRQERNRWHRSLREEQETRTTGSPGWTGAPAEPPQPRRARRHTGEGTGRGTGVWPRGAAEAGRAPAPPGARGCSGGAAASLAAGTLTDLAQGGHEEPPPFRAVLLAEEFVRLRRRLHGARRRLLRIGAVRLAAPRPATAPGAWGAPRGGKEKPPPPALVRAGPRWGSQPPLARLLTPPPGRPSHPAREGPGSGAARRALTGRRVRRRRPRSLRPRYRRRPPRACAAAPRCPPRPPRPAAPPGGRAGAESAHPTHPPPAWSRRLTPSAAAAN